jgi:hypothetical protein
MVGRLVPRRRGSGRARMTAGSESPRAPAAPILARPVATYRLQFHRAFTFRDAERLVPYLHDLGISHVYCSPYLRARAGSAHGYVAGRAGVRERLPVRGLLRHRLGAGQGGAGRKAPGSAPGGLLRAGAGARRAPAPLRSRGREPERLVPRAPFSDRSPPLRARSGTSPEREAKERGGGGPGGGRAPAPRTHVSRARPTGRLGTAPGRRPREGRGREARPGVARRGRARGCGFGRGRGPQAQRRARRPAQLSGAAPPVGGAALPARLLARGRRRDQLPPVLRHQRARRTADGTRGRLRAHAPARVRVDREGPAARSANRSRRRPVRP